MPKPKFSDDDLVAAARRSERRSAAATVDPPAPPVGETPDLDPETNLIEAGVVDDDGMTRIAQPRALSVDVAAPVFAPIDGTETLESMGVTDEPFVRHSQSLATWSHREPANALPQGNVPRTEVEQESLARSAAMVGRMAQVVNVIDADRPTRGPTPVDNLTTRVNAYGLDLGRPNAPYYRERAIFDHFKDRSGFRHTWSRFYAGQRLLVDFFSRPSQAIDAEVADKIRQLLSWNERMIAADRYGYLSCFAGDVISDNSLVAALHGEVFALPLRVPTNAPW